MSTETTPAPDPTPDPTGAPQEPLAPPESEPTTETAATEGEQRGTRYMVLYALVADRPGEDISIGNWQELGWYTAWDPHRAKEAAIAAAREFPEFEDMLKGDGCLVRAVAGKSWVETGEIKRTRLHQPPPELEVG